MVRGVGVLGCLSGTVRQNPAEPQDVWGQERGPSSPVAPQVCGALSGPPAASAA